MYGGKPNIVNQAPATTFRGLLYLSNKLQEAGGDSDFTTVEVRSTARRCKITVTHCFKGFIVFIKRLPYIEPIK